MTNTKSAMAQMEPRSTVLSLEMIALVIALRPHLLWPLGDHLFALLAKIPHLELALSLCCSWPQGIGRLYKIEGHMPKKASRNEAIGFRHIDIGEVPTE